MNDFKSDTITDICYVNIRGEQWLLRIAPNPDNPWGNKGYWIWCESKTIDISTLVPFDKVIEITATAIAEAWKDAEGYPEYRQKQTDEAIQRKPMILFSREGSKPIDTAYPFEWVQGAAKQSGDGLITLGPATIATGRTPKSLLDWWIAERGHSVPGFELKRMLEEANNTLNVYDWKIHFSEQRKSWNRK